MPLRVAWNATGPRADNRFPAFEVERRLRKMKPDARMRWRKRRAGVCLRSGCHEAVVPHRSYCSKHRRIR